MTGSPGAALWRCVGSRVEEWREVCAGVTGVREVLSGIDSDVDEYNRHQRLLDIHSRLADSVASPPTVSGATAAATTAFTVRDTIRYDTSSYIDMG